MHIFFFHSKGVAVGQGPTMHLGLGVQERQCCVEELPFCLDFTSK